MAKRSLYHHVPNWFHTSLALQDAGPLHTTWRYSDLIAVVYVYFFLTECSTLQDPDHGSVTFDSLEYQSVATYSCDKGFVLSGQEQGTCQASGKWTALAPTCQPKGK